MAHEFVASIEPLGTGNPFIQHIYTADPSAHVFEDKIYVYPSHDQTNANGFNMRDYHVFSSSDLFTWEDHGVALDVDDVSWAKEYMWAPDCVYKDGMYYFYFPAKDHQGNFKIGVATSQSPAGPFMPENDPIQGSFSVDPAVFIDDDGQAYMYFGGDGDGGQSTPWVAKLDETMKEFNTAPKRVSGARYWFEACWVHKIDGIYYLSYSTGTYHPNYPQSSAIAYATATDPMGPFTYQGIVNGTVTGWTNHHSTVEFKGQWYLFYHSSDLSGGNTVKRSICAEYLHFNNDGSIRKVKQTKQGIGSYDGLERIEAENYSETVGAAKQENNDGGLHVALDTNDTIVFYKVDFKEEQVNFIELRIASDADGDVIEIIKDNHDVLGEIQVINTGGFDKWHTLSGPIKSITGKTKIGLIFKGTEESSVNLNWIKFENNPNSVKTINEPLPQKYQLYQNYPNPFNPTTTINYYLSYHSKITLEIFNQLGERVSQPVNTTESAGYKSLTWNAANLSSGVYCVRLTAQPVDERGHSFTSWRKMLLLN